MCRLLVKFGQIFDVKLKNAAVLEAILQLQTPFTSQGTHMCPFCYHGISCFIIWYHGTKGTKITCHIELCILKWIFPSIIQWPRIDLKVYFTSYKSDLNEFSTHIECGTRKTKSKHISWHQRNQNHMSYWIMYFEMRCKGCTGSANTESTFWFAIYRVKNQHFLQFKGIFQI